MNNRNLALDGLRGFFLVIMAVNHLFGAFVRNFTAEPLGPVSAAEGFVLLSGIVFAMVYGARDNIFAVTGKRLWLVYRWQITGVIALVAGCFAVPALYEQVWAPFFGLADVKDHFWQTSIAMMTLTYVPGFHDVLVIYLVSLALAPIGLVLLRKGLGLIWLLASGALWLAAKWLNADMLNPVFAQVLPDIAFTPGYFDVLAWQFLFQIGLVLGFYAKHRNLDFMVANKVFNTLVVVSILAITIVWQLNKLGLMPLAVFSVLNGDQPLQSALGNDTPALGLMRIAYTLLVAYGAMLLVRYVPKLLSLRYFTFLGQHSIQVFVFHAVALYWIAPFAYPYNIELWWADLLISLAFALSLLLPAYLHSLWQNMRKKQLSAA
ncbi:OpgC domain-containing protein [Salinibius halmophilus]|uniref:OpgC domain-containing protein n=1 Tax=Salinibius halmophilus TaxID=1853216 RepID=UPI000E6624EE|nr:OpgC domain-containing protein [Salinibius halmophilus]